MADRAIPSTIDEKALEAAARLLNKRLAEGNLYGVTLDIIQTYVAGLSAGSVVENVMQLIERDLCIVWARPGAREYFAGELHQVLKGLSPNKDESGALNALRPFADFADALDENVPSDIAIGIFAGGAMRFGPSGLANVGSLRAARAVLRNDDSGEIAEGSTSNQTDISARELAIGELRSMLEAYADACDKARLWGGPTMYPANPIDEATARKFAKSLRGEA